MPPCGFRSQLAYSNFVWKSAKFVGIHTRMHIPWQDCEVFIAVAEFGSFSAAARRLRLTQPTVSRRIAALEEDLGRALFRRDSDGAHLTPDGARLLEPAQQMARWAAEMQRAASGWEEAPTGVVRIAAPPGVAFEVLVQLASLAADRLPEVRLDVVSGVEHIDLTRGEAELAIRSREPTQAELVVLASFRTQVGVFVAPSLAQRLPPGVVDASSLPWVTWAYPMEHVTPRPELEAALDPFTIAFASNDFLVQRRAVEAGLGAMVLARIDNPATPWGPLVEVPTNLELPASDVMHLACARSMRHVPRVAAVVDLIIEQLGNVEGLALELPSAVQLADCPDDGG